MTTLNIWIEMAQQELASLNYDKAQKDLDTLPKDLKANSHIDNLICPKSRNFSKIKANHLTISRSNIQGSNLSDTDISDSKVIACKFDNSPAVNLNLSKSTLGYTDFSLSDLTNANFHSSTLNFVSFTGANLTNTDFTGCTFKKGVIFIGAFLNNNNTLPDTAITTHLKLQEHLKTNEYSAEELKFLKRNLEHQYKRLDTEDSNDVYHINAGHLSRIDLAIDVLDRAINSLEKKTDSNNSGRQANRP